MESEPVKKSTEGTEQATTFQLRKHGGINDTKTKTNGSKGEVYWKVPVTCVALASVSIKARFSSSDSAERTVFGSLRKRVN